MSLVNLLVDKLAQLFAVFTGPDGFPAQRWARRMTAPSENRGEYMIEFVRENPILYRFHGWMLGLHG
ncbi:MAG: hypothetical protein U5L46_00635 [Agrobacterium sp.]|nr:hypothetical protein [Agrobacterium sp.]